MADHLNKLLFSDSEEEIDLPIPRERKEYLRTDFFELYDELNFKRRFRLSKESALRVLVEIERLLEYTSDKFLYFYFKYFKFGFRNIQYS